MASETFARLGVDHLDAVGCKLADRRRDIGDLERDVVHARAALGEETPDGRVGAKRGDELHASTSNPQVDGLYPLILHATAELDPSAEQPLVSRHRRVEVLDRHRDVVDGPYLHGP